MAKEKKHLNPVTLRLDEKSGKDPLLQIIGLAQSRKTDVTKDHDEILYGNLSRETIRKFNGARKRMRKVYVPHEKVKREFLR